MSLRCILCGNATAHVLGKRSDFVGAQFLYRSFRDVVADVSRFDRKIVLCAACGFQFIYPSYDEADLSALYQQDGYSGSQKKWRRHARKLVGRGRQRFVRTLRQKFEAVGISAWKESFVPTTQRTPSFLDVGCGLGAHLLTFHEMGFDVVGIDLSPYQVDYVKQHIELPVSLSSLEEYQPSHRFDCILASHVIEHVASPHEFIDKILVLLSPDGMLLIETPFLTDWGLEPDRYYDIYHSLFFDHFTLGLLGAAHGLQPRGITHITYRQGTMYHVYMLISFTRTGNGAGVDFVQSQLEWLRRCYDASHNAVSQWGRKEAGNLWKAAWTYLQMFGALSTLRATSDLLRRKLIYRNKLHP
jgi:SAM-dependent methyltransferase